jgi:hypothetical protein
MNGGDGDDRQSQQRADSERRIDERLRLLEDRVLTEELLNKPYRAKVDDHAEKIDGNSRLNGWLVGLSAFGGAIMAVVAEVISGHLPK